MRWILRYIKCTVDVGLIFEKDDHNKQECTGYVDSDYTEDLDKRRYRVCVHLVTLQSIVALSTTEAEYMVMTETMKEAI